MNSPSSEPRSLADSPWFFVLLFAGMGLAAVVVIAGKHEARQTRLIRMSEARDEVRMNQSGTAAGSTEAHDSTPVAPLVPDQRATLWPLMAVLTGVVLYAWHRLRREACASRDSAAEQDSHSAGKPAG
jgi:hypothetical protein